MLATTNVCPPPIRFQHMGRPGAEGPSLCRWVAKAIAPDPPPPATWALLSASPASARLP